MFDDVYDEATSGDEDFLICDDRFTVSTNFYQIIVVALDAMKVHLLQGNSYPPPELLGYELWFEWDSIERHMAILVLIHLVDSPDNDMFSLYLDHRSEIFFFVNSTF